jgi:hypothetical protein
MANRILGSKYKNNPVPQPESVPRAHEWAEVAKKRMEKEGEGQWLL